METIKVLAVIFMVVSILMPALSFAGADLPGVEKADLYLTSPTGFEVDQESPVTVNFYYKNTWGTSVSVSYGALCYDASGNVAKTISKTSAPNQVQLSNSYTFTAPSTAGSYNARIVWTEYITHPTYGTSTYQATTNIPFTVTGPPPIEYYTLTAFITDENDAPLTSADVTINSGSIGTTNTGGIVVSGPTESGSYTVAATKEGYNSNSQSVVLDSDKSITIKLTEVDPCLGVVCQDYCVGTSLYTTGICSDGACNYDVELNSEICGYIPDPCIGITCDDYCDGTTSYFNGECIDAECNYDSQYNSEDCGYIEPTPTPTPEGTPIPDPCEDVICEDYCEDNTSYFNGLCIEGECSYDTEFNSATCGYVEPTATPTETATDVPYSPPSSSSSSSDDDDPVEPPSTTYDLSLNFKTDDETPLSDVETVVNGVIYETDVDGNITILVIKDTTIDIISTKDGYNRFQQEVEMDADKSIKVTMTPSTGGFFTELGIEGFNGNPFYDPDGILGQIPIFVGIGSILSMGAGLFLFTKPL